MHFISDDVGWISTLHSSTLFHTTDSGISWQRYLTPHLFNSIFFSDSLKGWGSATSGEIYLTNDAGKSWKPQSCPGTGPAEIFFIDENIGWIAGIVGKILHTTNGGVTNVDSIRKKLLPENFILYQNYPNPFNSETIISFELTKIPNNVSAYIFDILGRRIRKLDVSSPIVGRNYIHWDGKNDTGNGVSSGIFFYSVSVDGIVLSKKIVLLK
jgi:hypothetical protein